MEASIAVVTLGDIVCAILDVLKARDATTPQWLTGTDVLNGVVVGVKLHRLAHLVQSP